ncbi:MAG: serine/threonine-protein kinase [Granulosicoccus sp.]
MEDDRVQSAKESDSDRTALMSARALSPGYEVLWYKIEDVLGQGGFGITYLAHDTNLDRKVAIKEYLPTTFAYRHVDYSVKPLTGDHRDNFNWGLENFLKEAKTLARFDHDNIVRVHSVFEKNNTAYMVMEYEHGENLAAMFKLRSEEQNQIFFERVFFPILEGLRQIHHSGFIHRDIKPANIYIRQNKTPVLIDFGSARQTSQQQTGEMTALISQGYTPLEQYSANYGDQGPWTDIYSLAATLYEGVTGKRPDDSLSRSACRMRGTPDPVKQLQVSSNPEYSQLFLNAVCSGLALEPEARPQTLDAWLLEFNQRVGMGSVSGHVASSEFSDLTGFDTAKSDRTTKSTLDGRIFESNTLMQNAEEHLTFDNPVVSENEYEDIFSDDDNLDQLDLTHKDSEYSGRKRTGGQQKNRKRNRTLQFGAVVVLLISIGGIYAWFSTGVEPPVIDDVFISTLPSPSTAVPVALPGEQISRQLDDIALLAVFYDKALNIKNNDPELLAGIAQLYDDLGSMVAVRSLGNYDDMINRILAVSEKLPDMPEMRVELRNLVESSKRRESLEKVRKLLETNRIFSPKNGSVIDSVNLLSKEDYKLLTSSELWKKALSQLREKAVEKIEESDFNSAARLVSAALIMQPGDEQMNSLRNHLTLR